MFLIMALIINSAKVASVTVYQLMWHDPEDLRHLSSVLWYFTHSTATL